MVVFKKLLRGSVAAPARPRLLLVWCAVACLMGSSVARAAVFQTNASSPDERGFLASSIDLINSGASSLLSVTHAGYAPFAYAGSQPTSAAMLNDGAAGAAYAVAGYPALNTVAFDSDGLWTSTYTLDTRVNRKGYDITSIRALSGWAASLRDQQFEVLLATVANPTTFKSYGTYTYRPGGVGSARITLQDTDAAIARNVSAIRFSVQKAGVIQTVYREFDVFGAPTGDGRPVEFQRLAPDDSRLAYSDYARLVKLDSQEARFDRIISGAQGSLQNANPGARIRFRTNATTLTASFTTGSLGVTSGTGVILIDGARAGTFNASVSNSALEVDVPVVGNGFHNVELIMPFAQDVRFNGLSVNPEAGFQPIAARPATRYVAYGDSITQGLWASDGLRNYPSLIGAQKGWEVVNMGFGWRGLKDSGGGSGDAAAVASLGADVISVMMGYNDASARLSATSYRASMESFVAGIRRVDGSVPIYLISPLYTSNAVNQARMLQYRDEIIDLVRKSFDARLYWIDGLTLGIDSSNVGRFTTDGIHPNDAGFALVADRLAPRMTLPGLRTANSTLSEGSPSLLLMGAGAQLQIVPEPGAIASLCAGAVIMLLQLRRRPGSPA